MAHKKSNWPRIEIAVAIKKEDGEYFCNLFNSSEWRNLNK